MIPIINGTFIRLFLDFYKTYQLGKRQCKIPYWTDN